MALAFRVSYNSYNEKIILRRNLVMANLKTVGVVITGVTGVLAWYNSCKSCVSIEDDDATSVAIRKATDSITYGILYGSCVKMICDVYNK